MKKLFLGLCLIYFGAFAYASQGLEKIIVEKYYVSDANDAAKSVGTLPEGSVTYRIYADMLPGYQFMMAYGTPAHPLNIKSTTSFFNNEDRGSFSPSYTKTNAKKNTVMLDSWLSAGAASAGNFGILKKYDDTVANVINSDGILKNADTTAGAALTEKDGLIAGTPGVFGYLGLDSATVAVFDNKSQAGNSFSVTNGSWYCLNGAVGPDSTNRVLIAQVTTTGVLSFSLNIQLRAPSGERQLFVAKTPAISDGIQEIEASSLSFAGVAVTGISLSPDTSKIKLGETKKIEASVIPATATNKSIVWKSSDNSIVTVSSSGIITPVAGGTAKIIAITAEGQKSDTVVVVITVPVTGVTLNSSSASIVVGATTQLTGTIAPSAASNKNLNWTSDKPTVATVSNTGLVTGISAGSATITVTTADGNKTATSSITVTEKTAVESSSNMGIELYPNPVIDVLTFKNIPANASIQIYDVKSRLIYTAKNASSVNVSGFNSGMYFLEISSKESKSTYKFIKK